MDKKVKIIFNKIKIPALVLASLVIVFMIVFLIGRTMADPNSGYLRNQTVDSLSFENANLVYENGITIFTVEVYNESGESYSLKNISINLTNDSNDVTTLVGYIGEELETDEGKLITASIDQDLSNSTSLEYVVNK